MQRQGNITIVHSTVLAEY